MAKPGSRHGGNPPIVKHQSIQHHQWNYPIPPPSMMSEYPPEIAQMFAKQWEIEAAHRRETEMIVLNQRDRQIGLEADDIRLAHRNELVSMALSFFIIAGLMCGALYLALTGYSISAVAAAVLAFGAFWNKRQAQAAKQKE